MRLRFDPQDPPSVHALFQGFQHVISPRRQIHLVKPPPRQCRTLCGRHAPSDWKREAPRQGAVPASAVSRLCPTCREVARRTLHRGAGEPSTRRFTW